MTRRVQLTQHTPMTIVNANAAIAWEAMLAGSKGFVASLPTFILTCITGFGLKENNTLKRQNNSPGFIAECRQ